MAKYFKCITNKSPLEYSCDENIIFNIYAREDGVDLSGIEVRWELLGDDGGRMGGSNYIDADNPLELKYSLNRPGFVHLICKAIKSNGEILEDFDQLDAGAGADIDKLEYIDTVPRDFDDYWKKIENLVADFPLEILFLKKETKNVQNGYKAFDVQIKTPSGRPASMCVTVPIGNKKYPIRLAFMGYGIMPAYYEYIEDTICACINAHGIENNKTAEELMKLYNVKGDLLSYGFDKLENESKMNNYWRGMMIRNLIALKFLKTIPEWNKKDIISLGGSQGALQAVTVAAHDSDVTRVFAYIPWFCNIKADKYGYLKGWRPEFAEGLRYFDTVAHGMKLKCPITICARLGDFVCPPASVMTFYNSIKCKKDIEFEQGSTHSYVHPEPEKFVYRDFK